MEFNPHAPVSNQPEEEALAVSEQPVLEPPSEGTAGAPAVDTSDGQEQVEGHVRNAFRDIPAGQWTAPTETLRDIGEASFGPPPPLAETVHFPDDRVQITNTAAYPWRVHASLLITAADNSRWIGTAWFIGPHTLATAGHVLCIKNSGVPGRDGWVRSISVMPGRNGTHLPYGAVTSTSFHSVRGWVDNGDENFDYGAITIPNDLGSTTGWFGFGVWPDADLLKSVVNISGYPGDQPAGTQWYDSRQVSSVNPLKVFYDIDTAGGQSGSAVYRIVNGSRYGIAIHAYGGATVNSGTRFTRAVHDNLVRWKA